MIPFLICPMYQLLSVGLLPGGTSLLTYYFLYWRRLLAETKTELLTVNKAEVLQLFLLMSTCLQRVNSQQPPGGEADKRLRQTVSCFHSGWVMWTVLWSRFVITIIDVRTWTRWRDAVWVHWGEAGARNRISSSDTPLNPIALLVKSSKEMSPHIGLTAGINRAPPTRCLSHEMNSLLWIAKSSDLMV